MFFRYLAILLILFFVVSNGAGQNRIHQESQFTDSLLKLIQKTHEDTSKAVLFNQLSGHWSAIDSGHSVRYARESLKLSQSDTYHRGLATFYLAGALYNFDVEKSKKKYLEAIKILEKDISQRTQSLLSQTWHNYGTLIQQEGDQKGFLNILLDRAIPLAQSANDTLLEAVNNADVGMVFTNIGNFEKAFEYYQTAINLIRPFRDMENTISSFYINLAQCYLYKNLIKEGRLRLDSARIFLNRLTLDDMDYNLAEGIYYSKVEEWKTSLSYLDSALHLAETFNLPEMITSILFQRHKTYFGAGNYRQAKKLLQKIYEDPTVMLHVKNRELVFFSLAQTDSALGNMKSAYDWLNKYTIISDSISKNKLDSDIAGLEIKYQSEKKQREILVLQNENKQQLLTLQKNRFLNYYLLAGTFILLLVSLIIFIIYINKRRRAEQEAELHKQQLNQIKQDQQLKIYNAMLEGQEQERKRLATDLHDGLGGMLAGVKLKLSEIADENTRADDNSQMRAAIRQLDDSVQELRHIARNMMPETLLRYGVEMALKDLCDSLRTKCLQIEFQSYQLDKDMKQSVQISIYRIVQELLANAVKHGNPTNILVQCSQNKERIFITIEDDGKGFDKESLAYKQGMGLSNVQNRVNYLKGKMDIQSQPGEGTIVNVEVNSYE